MKQKGQQDRERGKSREYLKKIFEGNIAGGKDSVIPPCSANCEVRQAVERQKKVRRLLFSDNVQKQQHFLNVQKKSSEDVKTGRQKNKNCLFSKQF